MFYKFLQLQNDKEPWKLYSNISRMKLVEDDSNVLTAQEFSLQMVSIKMPNY